MDAKELPARPSLEQYKKQAKDLLKACKAGDPEAAQRVQKHHPHPNKLAGSGRLKPRPTLADAQITIAREHGFESWPKFAKHIEQAITQSLIAGVNDPLAAFIEAACVPLDGSWHASGTLDRAEAILAAYPDVARSNIHAAAILGDDAGVRRFLALNAGNATAKGGPHGWDALTHLCLGSRRSKHKGECAADSQSGNPQFRKRSGGVECQPAGYSYRFEGFRNHLLGPVDEL